MSRISVKEFEERLARCFVDFTVADYKNYVKSKAEQIPPHNRELFITELEAVIKADAPRRKYAESATPAPGSDEYVDMWLDRIDAFQENYDDLAYRYENGEYDEDEYERMTGRYYGGSYFYDDDIDFADLNGFDTLCEEGYEIFLAAKDLFVEGHYWHARKLYEKAVAVINDMDYELYSLRSEPEGVDFIDELSRFVRCIYLTEEMASRPEAMYAYMQAGMFGGDKINLTSVIECAREDLDGIGEFLPIWNEYLMTQPVTSNSSSLIREAAKMIGGADGTKQLALEHGNQYPEAYLDWIMLAKSEKADITDICLHALSELESSDAAIKICMHLAEQSEENGNTGNCLYAWKKAFYYKKDIRHLVNMLKYAKIENRYQESLAYALDEIGNLPSKEDKRFLTFHIRLLGSEVDDAYQICKDDAELGWSYNISNVPIIMGYMMKLLSKDKDKHKAMIDRFWAHYSRELNDGCGYDDLVNDSINSTDLDDEQREKYYTWCEEICGKRVDSIVSNQHRNAYERAAMALVACSEAKSILYGTYEGTALIDKYLAKYPRHNKFHAAVRNNR
ncbi:MAG: hypothetical protein FWG53_03705 [Clostridiales bacterium]|nr:hypothetical protein [Clostridiales bacterium]